MPGKVLLLNTMGLLMQYVLLLLIYFFLYRVSVIIVQDLKGTAPVTANMQSIKKDVGKQAVLKAVSGAQTNLIGKSFQLAETTSIGRGEHNDIRIDDGFISHEHSCITRYKDEYWLADLQSTNCTYLNGQQVTEEVALRNGDVIKIGTVTFKFER